MSQDRRNRADLRPGRAQLDFISALRLGEGVNDRLLTELKVSIVELGDAWEKEDMLPKSVVNKLVGLFSWIDSASYNYKDDEAQRIRRIASEVEQMIFQHVVPDRTSEEA